MRVPDYTNRSPIEIITENIFFDSAGFVYRGLSWLDYAKRSSSVIALLYSALDIRHAIEQLLFEELVMSVGGKLDKKKYENCKGNATKLHKIIRRLSPDYAKLICFTKTIMSLIPDAPSIIIYDHSILLKYHGAVSNYLHWAGEPQETFESPKWFLQGVETVESAGAYLWGNMQAGNSGIIMPEKMQPELKQAWDDFRLGKIDLHSVLVRGRLALPVLSERMKSL